MPAFVIFATPRVTAEAETVEEAAGPSLAGEKSASDAGVWVVVLYGRRSCLFFCRVSCFVRAPNHDTCVVCLRYAVRFCLLFRVASIFEKLWICTRLEMIRVLLKVTAPAALRSVEGKPAVNVRHIAPPPCALSLQ